MAPEDPALAEWARREWERRHPEPPPPWWAWEGWPVLVLVVGLLLASRCR